MQESIEFRSHTVYYFIEGVGGPVILIHGFAEDHTIWNEQVKYLSKSFLVLVPDFPGSGISPFNPDIITVEDYAEVIDAILKNESIEKVVVIGHSMGGYITLAFAEKYAAKLRGWGLFHSTAYADNDQKKAARQKGIEFITRKGSNEFIKQSTPNLFSDTFNALHADIVTQLVNYYGNFKPESLVNYYWAMIKRPDRTNVLKSSKLPVLFIIGKNDTAIPLRDSLEQSHLPDLCYIHIAENAGHMAMLEDVAFSNNALDSFFRQIYRH